MEHMIHLPEFQVVICRKCQYTVLPSEVNSHFTPKHPHGFRKSERERIVDIIARIEGLIMNEEELKQCEFPFPADTSKPVVGLAAPQANGFRCSFEIEGGSTCPFVSKTIKRMQEHSFIIHRWENPQKPGRPKKHTAIETQEVPWRSGVQYQRFFK